MYENYSVLFVDDEVNILSALKRGLIDEEYSCFFASSGREALEIMRNEKIAVIVSDMRMPEMDGLHLLKIVKEQWPKTVAIILSGYTQLQQILTTINQIDIFKFITKPWNFEEEFKFVLYKALDYYILQEKNEEYKIALQNRNEAYQNIFKSIDTITSNAKNSCYTLGVLGKAILNYNRSLNEFLCDEFNDYEKTIYENFTDALTGEKKEYLCEKFESKLSQIIQSKIEVSKIENKLDSNLMIKHSPSIVEAVLTACTSVFEKEFKETGLVLIYGMSPNKFVTITFMSECDLEASNIEEAQKKADFLNSILIKTLKLCMIEFGVIIKNGQLLIIISIDTIQ
jgi:YesN/AraC family two-component response regulator